MTIDELYSFIQFMANKEQRGFIKPSEFNMLAERAQIDLIHDRVARYKAKDRPSSALEQNHSVLDDIRTVIKRENLVFNNVFIPEQVILNWAQTYPTDFPGQVYVDNYSEAKTGSFSYPYDYLHFIRLFRNFPDVKDESGNVITPGYKKDVKLITHDQYWKKKTSVISPITNDSPVSTMIDSGFEVFTGDGELEDTWDPVNQELISANITLVYIGKPKKPHWPYQMIDGMYVYNPSGLNRVDLELPEKTHNEIAQRMLSYIGISLRDGEPLSYAEVKVKDQKQ